MNRRALLATVFAGVTLVATGCSSGLVSTKGVVKLDGNPVEGATVTFVAESGNDTYVGTTDAKGEFSLYSTDRKSGAKEGTYKVIVTKSPNKGEPMKPGDPGAMTAMEKEAHPDPSKSGAAGGPKVPMMAGGKKGAVAPGVQSELPLVYANADTTPFKGIKVPSSEPIVLDLKSK